MADIYWKAWEKALFAQGSHDFFSEVNPLDNQFFSSCIQKASIRHQVILLAFLPQDRTEFITWLNRSASPWLTFLLSLAESTSFFSLFSLTDQVHSHPVFTRAQDTAYIKIDPQAEQKSPFKPSFQENNAKQDSQFQLKNAFLPTMLYDADRIVSITCLQKSYSFGQFSTLSSLFYLLPTLTQVEILLHPSVTMQSQALVQAVYPLLQKMSFTLQVNFAPTPFMLVSNDPLSADAYSAMMNSIKVSSLPYLKMASKKQLGISDLLMIHNRSERFRKPVNQKKVNWSRRSLITFSPNCTCCGQCVTACPLQALSISEDRRLIWNSSVCNRCGLCLDICPESAIRT